MAYHHLDLLIFNQFYMVQNQEFEEFLLINPRLYYTETPLNWIAMVSL